MKSAPIVLVVDADALALQRLAAVLRRDSYTVFAATHGLVALQLAHEVQPSAVILEVTLPGTGFDLLGQLRAHHILAPAIFLSARAELQDKVTGLTVGGDDYITKPFDTEEVLARLVPSFDAATAQRSLP